MTAFKQSLQHKLLPAGIYLFKVNNGKTRTLCGIYKMLTTKTPERHRRGSSAFVVNFKQISNIVPGFPMLNLSNSMPAKLKRK